MTVEEKLRKYLMDKGIKFSFVAEKANMNCDKFSKCLTNKRKLTGGELIKICLALKLELDFFNGVGDPQALYKEPLATKVESA